MNIQDYQLAVQVAIGAAKGKTATDFSVQGDLDQMIRGAFLEKIGVEKIDQRAYRKYKTEVFEIIEDAINPIINDRLSEVMGRFAEVRNVDFGDKPEFIIDNPELFEVAVIADGTTNLRRQRIENGKLPVEMRTYGIKIYDELYRFLAGRINWTQLVEKVAKSFERKLAEDIFNAIYGSYDRLDTGYKYTGSYNENAILDVLAHVSASTGNAMIVGTKQALARLRPEYIGGGGKDSYNALGYLAIFHGYEVVEMTQSMRAGTNDFALPNSDLLILPSSSEKIVKVVHEGQALVQDEQLSASQEIEHTITKKMGIAVPLAGNQFGVVRLR